MNRRDRRAAAKEMMLKEGKHGRLAFKNAVATVNEMYGKDDKASRKARRQEAAKAKLKLEGVDSEAVELELDPTKDLNSEENQKVINDAVEALQESKLQGSRSKAKVIDESAGAT